MWTYLLQHTSEFFLVLLRMIGFIGASPMMSLRSWPNVAKIGLAGLMALWILPTVGSVPAAMDDPGQFIVEALFESITGMATGFLATLIFSMLQVAGQFIDLQIGLNSAGLLNPATSQMSTMTGTFYNILFSVYFIGMNGLDGLALAAMSSYRYVPLGSFRWTSDVYQLALSVFSMTMILAIQLAAPLIAALLLTDITFAFLSRAVPQMNVYVVGLPVKLLVGFTMFAVVMPGVVYIFRQLFSFLFTALQNFLQALGG